MAWERKKSPLICIGTETAAAFLWLTRSKAPKSARLSPDAQIYVLQGMGDDNLELFSAAGLTPVVSCLPQFEYWKQHRIKGVKPVIHVETGLNRLGFREKDLQQLDQTDCREFGMVMSHLACADVQGHFMNARQLEEFTRLRRTYFPELPGSLSASDGVFLGTEFHFDMVRLGAAMYGINTAPYRRNIMRPVIRLTAPVCSWPICRKEILSVIQPPIAPIRRAGWLSFLPVTAMVCRAHFPMSERFILLMAANAAKEECWGVFPWII